MLPLFQGVPYVLRWCSAGIQERTIVSPVLRGVPLFHHCSVFRCFMFRRSWFYRKSSSPLFLWIDRTSLQQLKISNKFVCTNQTNHGIYREFREWGVSSNSQSTCTTPNSLTVGDIIESNKAMFNALTEVLKTTLTSMSNQLHEHSKCQIE